MHAMEFYLIAIALLLIVSVVASKATGRFGVPALIVFLGIGMLAGSEGFGGIHFDSPFYAQILGVVSLIYILFASGMDTDLKTVRPVMVSGAILSTVGVAITCILTGFFSTWLLGFQWMEGLLLGAIISSTDAAAVFSVLRARGIFFRGQIRPLLELESGLNDPMGVLLTIAFIQILMHQESSITGVVLHFIQQFILGGAIGLLFGKGAVLLLNRIKLEFEGLYPVITLSSVILIYGVSEMIGGNGFLAVYLAGLVMGNLNFVHKKSLILFHDGIAWLVQIAMFLVLGLLVFPSRLIPIAWAGLLISVFLIFFARPIAVFASLMHSKFSNADKTMISWVGLRGSVPIILATYPYLAGVEKADMIFHLVFFIVITSILIQGPAIPLIAKWLSVDVPAKKKFRYPLQYIPTENMRNDLVEVEVGKKSPVIGRSVIDLKFPGDALIVLIQRQGDVIVPKGSTLIESGDTMLVLSDKKSLKQVREIVKAE